MYTQLFVFGRYNVMVTEGYVLIRFDTCGFTHVANMIQLLAYNCIHLRLNAFVNSYLKRLRIRTDDDLLLLVRYELLQN